MTDGIAPIRRPANGTESPVCMHAHMIVSLCVFFGHMMIGGPRPGKGGSELDRSIRPYVYIYIGTWSYHVRTSAVGSDISISAPSNVTN